MPTLHTLRTRSRSDFGPVTYVQTTSLGGSYSGSYSGSTYYEVTHDNVNQKVRGHFPASDISHLELRANLPRDFVPSYQEGWGTVFNTAMPSVIFSWDPVLALLPVVSDSLWGSLALDSYNEFSTQIPEEISLPNFIWEFKEIGSLLPKLEDTLSKTIASGYLNWNFGWKPFLQDLSTLGNLVGTVRAKIAYLKSRFGKPTRLSFYRPNLVSIPFLRDWNDTSTGIYQLRLASYMANFRASGTLYHELEGLDSLDGELRAFTVALGLTNPVKAFWNAVPFSFVVDWFGRLGSRLFQHTVNPYQGLWQVYDLTCSVSETAQVDVRWSYRHDLNGYPHIGHIAVNRYTRLARLPLELSSFNLESLSPKQQMLSLALLRTVTR